MGIDWSFAGQVGAAGFGMVFFLPIVLAAVIRLTGLILNRGSAEKNNKDDAQKGA